MKKRRVVLSLLGVLSVGRHVSRPHLHFRRESHHTGRSGSLTGTMGWVLSAFIILYGIFEIPTGAMGDRIGHRSVLTRIVVWWSAFTALTGFAWNYAALVIARFMFGGRMSEYLRSIVVPAIPGEGLSRRTDAHLHRFRHFGSSQLELKTAQNWNAA